MQAFENSEDPIDVLGIDTNPIVFYRELPRQSDILGRDVDLGGCPFLYLIELAIRF